MIYERLEQRRMSFACTKRNLAGLTKHFEDIIVHENYLHGVAKEDFYSGMDALAQTFRKLYTEMISDPQNYAMKDDNDSKGLSNNMNFLFQLAQTGTLNDKILEVEGKLLALTLKEAKVTKAERYFHILESLGFVTTGLGAKIETSEMISVEYPDNNYLLAVLKAMTDAICMFSSAKPHQISSNYFELLDYRLLENYPATEPTLTFEYLMSKIKGESRDIATMFYEFIMPLTKCQVKGDFRHYWTITFTLKTTKKVIMSLRVNLESHDVKLNLFNLGKYTKFLIDFPTKMLHEIKHGGWETDNDDAFVFELGGKTYKKDPDGSFVFTKPNKSESMLLIELLKKELSFL